MTAKKIFLDAGWHTNLPRFQGAQPDQVRVESSSCCCPKELESFVRTRTLENFDQWHVTRSPPIRNVLELGDITIYPDIYPDIF